MTVDQIHNLAAFPLAIPLMAGPGAITATLLLVDRTGGNLYAMGILIALIGAVVLFCLAVFYVIQDAPFLGLVQVIVYAGAIMVLFLFVIMLIGVDFSDSLTETLRGQRPAAILLGLGFAGMLIFPIARTIAKPSAAGLGQDGFNNNVNAIARRTILMTLSL